MRLTKDTIIEGEIFKKGTSIRLQEMPHLVLKDGTPFDVEIEVHLRNEVELLDYFHDVLSGEEFTYKDGGVGQLDYQQREELADYLSSNHIVKLMILKKYEQKVYDDFILMVNNLF